MYDLPLVDWINAKSQFRQTAKVFNVIDELVYYKGKVVIIKDEVKDILKACHDSPETGGHFGRDKTYGKVAERFYWKGMKKDIIDYVKSCKKCVEVNPKVAKEAPPLHPIPVPAKVWSLVGIDIVGPLQETNQGNKYIVAITDHFSKWSEAKAIPDKSAESVAKFLYSVVCRLGCMETLISDQGREFVNEVIDSLMVKFKTDHRISSAYHPQTNGQRERDNRTLKVTREEANSWPAVLYLTPLDLAFFS